MTKGKAALRHFRAHLYDETDECMIWPFSTARGYGRLNLNGQVWGVHTLACIAWHGPRPEGLDAAHGPCHNRTCWNGAHLSWKTRAENIADMVRDGTAVRGEKKWNAKLTAEDVRAIRAAGGDAATRQALALVYGVSRTTVRDVVLRKTWASI